MSVFLIVLLRELSISQIAPNPEQEGELLKRCNAGRKVVDIKEDSGKNNPSFASEHSSPMKPPKPLKRKSKRVGAHRELGMLESESKCRSPSGPLRVHANA